MNFGDRVKQAGTATSDAVYVLSGAADSGYKTFFDGLNIPTLAALAGAPEWHDVPILVESGANWQLVTATVWRSSTTNDVAIKDAVVRSSSTGAALGLTGSAPVTLSIVPTKHAFNGFWAPPITHASALLDYQNRPNGVTGAAFAAGYRAQAMDTGAVAMGQRAECSTAFGAAIGGYNARAWHGGQVVTGIARTTLGAVSAINHLIANGVLNALTTDATPTNLAFNHNEGTAAGSDAVYCMAGLTTIEGMLSAVQRSTGDRKLWSFRIVAETNELYTTTTLVEETFTSVVASAGAATWAIDAVPNSGTNSVVLQATGEAAKTLTWACTYTIHYHGVDSL